MTVSIYKCYIDNNLIKMQNYIAFCIFIRILQSTFLVALAVDLMPIASPKSGPAPVNYNLYILFSVKEILFPQLCIYTYKLQCNEEKPLNDIPRRKGTT